MIQRYLGIDIGTYNIKIADIAVDKKSVSISEPVVVHTPRFLVQNGRITEKEDFVTLLKEVLSKRKSKVRKAIVILNDSIVITRDRELPAAKPKELEQMVKLDASEFLPFDISEYTIRYKVLLDSKDNPKGTNYILMSSVKNDLFMDFYEVLAACGIRPAAVDTTINGMIKYMKRYINSGKIERDKAIAMIDFGATSAKIVIICNGVPTYQQIMNHSSQKIDIMISTGLNIERDHAEDCKIEFGLSFLKENHEDDMARAVGSIINNQIDLILGDLYKHFQSFMSKSGGRNVDHILLTGGMANMKGLSQYIHDSFNIPCSVVKTTDNITMDTNSIEHSGKGNLRDMQFSLFTNLTGAACRGE